MSSYFKLSGVLCPQSRVHFVHAACCLQRSLMTSGAVLD